MLLDKGNKLLVTHRRLFEGDASRYFVGEVIAYENGIAKVRGYSFVRDVTSAHLLRKEDPRTKLIALGSDAHMVYQLPDDLDVESVRIDWSDGGLRMVGNEDFGMNLAETPHGGTI